MKGVVTGAMTEGSATEGRVFKDACWVEFAIPPGTYYLANLSFGACNALVVPFRNVRYHLREWALSAQQWVLPFPSFLLH